MYASLNQKIVHAFRESKTLLTTELNLHLTVVSENSIAIKLTLDIRYDIGAIILLL